MLCAVKKHTIGVWRFVRNFLIINFNILKRLFGGKFKEFFHKSFTLFCRAIQNGYGLCIHLIISSESCFIMFENLRIVCLS